MADELPQDALLASALNGQTNDLSYMDFIDLLESSAPELGFFQGDLVGSDVLMQELQEPWDPNVSDNNCPPTTNGDNDGKADEPGGDGPLDMNDPSTLATFTSLVIFANDPLAQHVEFGECDHSQQITLQALATKLQLQYSYDVCLKSVQIRKDSVQAAFLNPTHSEASDMAQGQSHCNGDPAPVYSESRNTENNRPIHDPTISKSYPDSDFLSNGLNLTSFDQETFLDGIGLTPLGTEDTDMAGTSEKNRRGLAKHNIYNLYSDHGSTQSVSSSIASRAWRGPWDGLTRTLKGIGACWRCKILRKKCDPEEPCKACPKSENKSRWQSIGCRRGTLLDHSPAICLCPKAIASADPQAPQGMDLAQLPPENSLARQARQLLQSMTVRLEEVICSTEDTYNKVVLDILCSPVVDLSEVRCQEHNIQSNVLTIVWGLVDTPSVKNVLRVEDIDELAGVMRAAVVYEMEYGNSNISSLAIECLRNCIDILRLPDFLTPTLHADCNAYRCEIESFRLLKSNIQSFLEEFSGVIFRKENRAPDRKWWLSAFYGLYLQSFVRQSIMFLERSPLAHLQAPSQTSHQSCSTYLRLALELFEAASAPYDPLVSIWSLEKEPSESKLDLRLIKYYRTAQQAFNTAQWTQKNIYTSIDFLNHMYYNGPLTLKTPSWNEQNPRPALFVKDSPENLGISIQPPHDNADNSVIYEGSIHHSLSNNEVPSFPTFKGRSSVPTRAKRRASSPPQENNQLQRNDSSSSMLNVLNTRHRGLSIASQSSQMSSAFSFTYDTSSSPRWNGSEESLAGMGQLLHSDSPALLSPYKRGPTSLHTKSSNESFLEMPRTLHRRRSRGSLSKDTFLCDCCPAKPKKFDYLEALIAHQSERQYECGYCGNRFKTKNEAERHQESLHIRRRAWSCSVLQSLGFHHSFHNGLGGLGQERICGFCGDEIPAPPDLTHTGPESSTKHHERLLLEHVENFHRVSQCNTSKKFYRADHFRQHLKHTHGAKLGKWTSVLEAKCMKEEDPAGRSDA